MPVMANSSYNQYGRNFETWTYIHPLQPAVNQSNEVSVISRTFETDAYSKPFTGVESVNAYFFDKREYFPAIGNTYRWQHGYWSDYSQTPVKSYGGADTYSMRPRSPSKGAGQLSYNSYPIQQSNFNWLDHGYEWDRVHDRALSKIWDQVRSGPNLIVDLVEAGATLRMLRAATSLRGVMREFFDNLVIPRKLRADYIRKPVLSDGRNLAKYRQQLDRYNNESVKLMRSRLDYISSKWLEYRYGWSPLVYTIYDSLEALNARIFDEIYEFKGRSGLKYRTEWSDLAASSNYNPDYLLSGAQSGSRVSLWEYTRSTRCHMVMRYSLPAGQQIYNWTSLNPYSVSWELLPLSFVADWVFQVGDYLESMENAYLFASNFRGGYFTKTFMGSVRNTYDIQYANKTGYNPGMAHSSWAGWGMDRKFKARVLLTSQPRPLGIQVRPKLNAKRMLDAASLLQQLVGKRFR